MHGIGLYSWADKKSYEGEYHQDKKQGYGRYSWPDGREYKGYWKDGKQHGLGEYTVNSSGFPQKQVRYGLWEQGTRKKWFAITQGTDLQQQLDSTEENLFVEQKAENVRRSEEGLEP